MSKTREILEYLKNNPGFFEEHMELLADMQLVGDGVNPFHQRQVEVLRDRHEMHKERLGLIVDTARNNEDVQRGMHAIAVSLLASVEQGESVDSLLAKLVKNQFDVDEVQIHFEPDPVNPCADIDYPSLAQRVTHLGSVCDDRVSSSLREALFPHRPEFSSFAFVPLTFEQELLGVMVLASADRARFTPGVGVLFLDRLGQLIGAYAAGSRRTAKWT